MKLKKLFDFSDEDFALKFCEWARVKFPAITFSHEEGCTVQASDIPVGIAEIAQAWEAASRSQCK
jgi:hypothetical protein